MASYVFDRLGETLSLAPELTVSTLWTWKNSDADLIPPLPEGIKPQQRIDLALT
jgi:hypothetical protein